MSSQDPKKEDEKARDFLESIHGLLQSLDQAAVPAGSRQSQVRPHGPLEGSRKSRRMEEGAGGKKAACAACDCDDEIGDCQAHRPIREAIEGEVCTEREAHPLHAQPGRCG